ncbi:hypothetical protein GWK47_032192 [Chionoecetes opilio]|uniref:Uncharacterized protein n=1 Tax=Chionoecetes opilio TaxID=41210 RepID=A0A8J4YJY9_CHIOP|nr:hypothetical protein GWK47_032192 [Chionoecetes opilio]
MGGWLRSSPSHAPPPPDPPMGSCGGFGGTWSATPLACHVCAEMGGWLRRSCWCPTFPAPSPGPSHGPGRGVERPLAATSTPPPSPDHPLTWGSGQCVWRCRWGFWGRFVLRLVPFPLTVLPFFSSGSIVRPRAARCLLGPEATSSAPRTPRAFCRTFFVPPIARYAVDGCGSSSRRGVCPALLARPMLTSRSGGRRL